MHMAFALRAKQRSQAGEARSAARVGTRTINVRRGLCYCAGAPMATGRTGEPELP
jgi:hypothetical protein